MPFSSVGAATPKYHGIQIDTQDGINRQWEQDADKISDLMDADGRAFRPRSIEGRMHLARGRYIGKVTYKYKHQVATETVMESVCARLQQKVTRLVLGATPWIKVPHAMQRKEDGGVAMLNVHDGLRSMWAKHAIDIMAPEKRPWKNFARYHLRAAYGEKLGNGTRLLTANYTFSRITTLPVGGVTERMRQTFAALGKLPRLGPLQQSYTGQGMRLGAKRRAR